MPPIDTDQPRTRSIINAFIQQSIPAVPRLGIEVVELREGRAVSALPLEGNANHFGAMYAGSLFCAGELLAGVLVAPSFDFAAYYPTVKHLAIDYLRPARTDVLATAELDTTTLERMRADVTAQGRASWQLDVEITDTSGEIVATMSGECQVRSWT
ncbi:PaaI family thioesterase [Lolliginicoccus suaedae]|uniref:PaaI family thioesterase n=1 Tax=Lolliginicoccus suaedae TaxID=2605429 RepID=UPI00165A10BF|nr:YiiD C-terminal domain-containing protein [Lolliginicoccus suaedae]